MPNTEVPYQVGDVVYYWSTYSDGPVCVEVHISSITIDKDGILYDVYTNDGTEAGYYFSAKPCDLYPTREEAEKLREEKMIEFKNYQIEVLKAKFQAGKENMESALGKLSKLDEDELDALIKENEKSINDFLGNLIKEEVEEQLKKDPALFDKVKQNLVVEEV